MNSRIKCKNTKLKIYDPENDGQIVFKCTNVTCKTYCDRNYALSQLYNILWVKAIKHCCFSIAAHMKFIMNFAPCKKTLSKYWLNELYLNFNLIAFRQNSKLWKAILTRIHSYALKTSQQIICLANYMKTSLSINLTSKTSKPSTNISNNENAKWPN